LKRPATCTSSSTPSGPAKRRPAANGDVNALGNQIGFGVIEHKVQPNPRMCRQKAGQPLHREEVEEVSRGGHTHQATGLPAARHQFLACVHKPIHRAGATFVEGQPGTGECQVAGGALHQPGTQLGFELLDATAHGVWWHAQAPCRLGKAAAAHHLHKHGDVVQIQHGEEFLRKMDE
jgi:hypothetical protein